VRFQVEYAAVSHPGLIGVDSAKPFVASLDGQTALERLGRPSEFMLIETARLLSLRAAPMGSGRIRTLVGTIQTLCLFECKGFFREYQAGPDGSAKPSLP